ncbi:hypothetical protein [Actinomyces sp. W5033]|uniref:hypothetical protein n=1 Tax=Actinomyces sp. W5033 TaxID=3446479 RepID=UPI003EE25929
MRRCSALLSVTAALLALATAGGCASGSGGDGGSASPRPTAASVGTDRPAEETLSTAAALAPFEAPSPRCAAMNGVLLTALAETPQGQAFTAAPDGAADKPVLWGAFAQALEDGYGAQLDEAAGGEAIATGAREALREYIQAFERLSSGEVVEFSDRQSVQEAMAEGRAPTPDPDYTRTVETMTSAHVTLTQCLADWPVVF